MMKIRPLHDRIVLRRLEVPQQGTAVRIANLIIIPDSAKEPSTLCEVIAVGPGRWRETEEGERLFEPTTLRPGEKVIIGQYNDFEHNGEGFLICMEADVRVVVEREPSWTSGLEGWAEDLCKPSDKFELVEDGKVTLKGIVGDA